MGGERERERKRERERERERADLHTCTQFIVCTYVVYE